MKTWYYFIDPEETGPDKFIAIDHSSGGYPHNTDSPNDTMFWSTPEEALSYQRMFRNCKGWVLKELKLD